MHARSHFYGKHGKGVYLLFVLAVCIYLGDFPEKVRKKGCFNCNLPRYTAYSCVFLSSKVSRKTKKFWYRVTVPSRAVKSCLETKVKKMCVLAPWKNSSKQLLVKMGYQPYFFDIYFCYVFFMLIYTEIKPLKPNQTKAYTFIQTVCPSPVKRIEEGKKKNNRCMGSQN